MNPTRLHAIMSGEARDLNARLARVAMSCAEPFYRGAVAVRNAMFDWGIRKPKKLPRPVISIGNITTGGTGKTPMVIEIVRRLVAMGHKPAVLLRGYGHDEVYELEGALGHGPSEMVRNRLGVEVKQLFDDGEWSTPIVPDPNRRRGGLKVIREARRVSVFVLDDGYQHRQLHRDLDLLLVDAMEPFGFDRLLPRGLLREPAPRSRRADAVIISRADRVDTASLNVLSSTIQRMAGKAPLAHAVHRWTGFEVYAPHLIGYREGASRPPLPVDAPMSRDAPLDALADVPVVAVCGIANPVAYLRALELHGMTISARHVFADHHQYTREEVIGIINNAEESGAKAVVMTEKDYVKWMKYLPPYASDSVSLEPPLSQPPPIYRPRLEIEFVSGGDAVDDLLRQFAC